MSPANSRHSSPSPLRTRRHRLHRRQPPKAESREAGHRRSAHQEVHPQATQGWHRACTQTRSNTEDPPDPRERLPLHPRVQPPRSRPAFTKPWEEEKADRLAPRNRPPAFRDETKLALPLGTVRSQTRASTEQGSALHLVASHLRFEALRPDLPGDKPASAASRASSSVPARLQPAIVPRSAAPKAPATPVRHAASSRRALDAGAGDSGSDRPRKTFSKPGTFGRKREGFAGKPSFSRDNDARPPRREFTPRPEGDSRDSRPPRRTFGDRPDKPSFSGPRKPGSYSPCPRRRPRLRRRRAIAASPRASPSAPRRFGMPSRFGGKPSPPATARGRGDRQPEERSGRPSGPPLPQVRRSAHAPVPTARRGSAPETTPKNREQLRRESHTARPAGLCRKVCEAATPVNPEELRWKIQQLRPARNRTQNPLQRPGKPASTFDKFKGNKKPFGKRPPARKFKPEGGE